MTRESFLARVRSAAEMGRAYRVHKLEVPADAGYCGAGHDPVARFAEEVIAVGGYAHVVESAEEARSVIGEILAGSSARSALCWEHPTLERLGLRSLLSGHGVALVSYGELSALSPAEQRRRMMAADVGITGVSWAVAETGTIAVASAPGAERLASLTPPVHIAVVERDRILPDLFDLFAKYGGEGENELPSNLSLITGPSKTGDIELRLTTGVHGPGVWHVVVV